MGRLLPGRKSASRPSNVCNQGVSNIRPGFGLLALIIVSPLALLASTKWSQRRASAATEAQA
ncbi:hypothetical protein [Sphingomonas kyeonggiensis]|uniref:DMSO/TMAO reductase YedYZ heme-binding membrane subunit n=1 Tax=Sphingomonas kyeonggiensis TaxID=1268553 RepID=A0A7W6NZE8_9SPHN|nr:hypothetical protein [Sphingomonas kyeonggiensis]MBB4100746.1 DMSO/TMAO reductase YedYZ heme-binding membrane subunit [Sphingomonas kyeonggiensis]